MFPLEFIKGSLILRDEEIFQIPHPIVTFPDLVSRVQPVPKSRPRRRLPLVVIVIDILQSIEFSTPRECLQLRKGPVSPDHRDPLFSYKKWPDSSGWERPSALRDLPGSTVRPTL